MLLNRARLRLAALLVILASVALASCVSTMMEGYIGKPIEEAYLDFGKPIQVLDMPDGRRAFQFQYGGGPVYMSGHSTTQIVAGTNSATIATTDSPAAVIDTPGCVLTFFAVKEGEAWMVRDIRVPGGLTC